MNTQPGIQTAFPWFDGQPELHPVNNEPEPFTDSAPHPEAIGLRVVAIIKGNR